jgi:hypothetical protein
LFLCVISVFVIGERANLLVLGVALAYFLLETARSAHRSVRVSILFQITCVLGIIGAGTAVLEVLAPQQISNKIERSVGIELGSGYIELMEESGVPTSIITIVSTMPVGDFAGRLALTLSSLWFFFQHPISVGFWGEIDVVGWGAHHEIVKILLEQGVLGVLAFLWLINRLWKLLWLRQDFRGSWGEIGVLMRSVSVGLFAALIMANSVLLDMKFAIVYWTLLGIWSALPRTASPMGVVIIRETELVNA